MLSLTCMANGETGRQSTLGWSSVTIRDNPCKSVANTLECCGLVRGRPDHVILGKSVAMWGD